MTILNESGSPDVISPLQSLSSLARRLPDTLFIVVGTRADAHLALSLSFSPLPGSPPVSESAAGDPGGGVAFVVLDPDIEPASGALSSRVVEAAAGARRPPKSVMLVARRSARLLGVDAAFEAELAGRRLGVPVRAVEPSAGPPDGGTNALATDLEDAVLEAFVGLCPRVGVASATAFESEDPVRKGGSSLLGRLRGRGAGHEVSRESAAPRPVVLLGGSEASRPELAAELGQAGVEVVGGVPGRLGDLPEIGEGTVAAPLDPYLTRACRAAEERGALVVRTLMPIGVDGTARFLGDVAAAAGYGMGGATAEAQRARQAWSGLNPLRARLRGKRVFFTGDTGLEVPLGRFLANAGAVVVEVGVPRLERRFLAADLSALGADVDVVEAPDWRAQLGRIDEARPDVVVASPGLYAPLVARGHLVRSSLDLLALDLHGYAGARRVLTLFARTFERAETLDALDL